MRTHITLPALVAALGLALPVQAAIEPAARQKVVRYHDLDLSKPTDRKRLEFRVKHAARVVCDIVDTRNVPSVSESAQCYNRAIGGARQQLAARGIDVLFASL